MSTILECLELLGEEFKADPDIPKDTANGLDGVYLEPAPEECGLRFVTLRMVFGRPNSYLIGMWELRFDIGVYDTDPEQLLETLTHITATYPIPLEHDQLVGASYRMDELHFQDARLLTKPKLTTAGGGVHHLPIQAYAVIKPVGSS